MKSDCHMTPPDLQIVPSRLALFLDIDGTLAPVTPRPEQSRIPLTTRRLLGDLLSHDVAVAALSGRPLAQVRRLLHPLGLAAGGSHGAQFSFRAGRVMNLSPRVPSRLIQTLEAGVSNMPGVWVERKPGAVAVHWRQAVDLSSAVDDLVHQALRRAPGWCVMPGRCVHEVKLKNRHKGRALRRLMRQPEFAGRWPLAIGDDRTDEDAFEAALALGGGAIRVGPARETLAPWQLADAGALVQWLRRQQILLKGRRRVIGK